MSNIPQIYPPNFYFKEIKRLSPSSYANTETECKLRYVLSRALSDGERVCSNFNFIYGIVAHELFYLRKRGLIQSRFDFKNKWKQLLKEKENNLIAKYPTLRNVQLADFQLCNDCWKIAEKICPVQSGGGTSRNNYAFGSEIKVSLGDTLIGSVDSVLPYQDGAEIIDYKTGQIYDADGKIKESYVVQLNLYAIMFESQYGISVKRLTIIDKSGQNIDVQFNRLSLQEVKSNTEQHIAQINCYIRNNDAYELAKFSDKCKFCECRHLCNRFLDNADPTQILKGKVTNVPNKNVIELQTVKHGDVIINNLDSLDLDLQGLCGSTLIFVNLYQPNEGKPFSIHSKTFIFKEVLPNE